MSLRTRLLGISLLTLAIGVGALLVIGNVLLRTGVHDQAQSVLRARAEAQLAALNVTATSVGVRDAPNDQSLVERLVVVGVADADAGRGDVQRCELRLRASTQHALRLVVHAAAQQHVADDQQRAYADRQRQQRGPEQPGAQAHRRT